MNETAIGTVAHKLLPLIVTLVQARKQARWQWKHCADENKHKWTAVVNALDHRIAQGELVLEKTLDIQGFRTKREVIE